MIGIRSSPNVWHEADIGPALARFAIVMTMINGYAPVGTKYCLRLVLAIF